MWALKTALKTLLCPGRPYQILWSVSAPFLIKSGSSTYSTEQPSFSKHTCYPAQHCPGFLMSLGLLIPAPPLSKAVVGPGSAFPQLLLHLSCLHPSWGSQPPCTALVFSHEAHLCLSFGHLGPSKNKTQHHIGPLPTYLLHRLLDTGQALQSLGLAQATAVPHPGELVAAACQLCLHQSTQESPSATCISAAPASFCPLPTCFAQ